MTDLSIVDLGRNARRLRVDTLVRLRWLAVAGQSCALLVVHFVLGYGFPLVPCFLAIAASAALNIGLRLKFARNDRLDEGPATALLTFDLLQLAALLYLTGGIENPFVTLALAPVVISAVSLPRGPAAYLVLLMIALAAALAFAHLPLPWKTGTDFSLPSLYRAGIWVALGLTGGFVALYASRVADEARRLSDALAATELVLAREQHLSQLDGLAAAAAHELGTPLATIGLIAKEWQKAPTAAPAADDIELLSQQVRRCRDILGKLTSLGNDTGSLLTRMTLPVLVEEVIEPHRNFGVVLSASADGPTPAPVCARSPGVLYGLGNFVENAVDFARSRVDIEARWTEAKVSVLIRDDGPGFAPEILTQLGEPYVTTRAADRRAKIDESSGLGLGLFIAKTLLERSGAAVRIGNRSDASGARIAIEWPRAAFERKDEAVATP
ncbi:MAG: ActS/PrrB/RegB family redox-sensitive histidine kinase [Hyphomicrobiales bacterium]|nr:ActS/PrrB/RegB family redox-sensitive histidine kinase [Hyphomicrobiales bacterium]